MQIKNYDDLQQVEMVLSFGMQKMTVFIYFMDGLLIDKGPVKMATNLIPLFQQWDMTKGTGFIRGSSTI
jgi:endoribonuclease LACTB2